MNVIQLVYLGYQHRQTIKRILAGIIIVVASLAFLLYLIVATVIAVIQGNGNIGGDSDNPNITEFVEFQRFSYKTFYSDIWYDFVHPYHFPTLGVLTQGVILDSSAKVGSKHIAWDIADRQPRQTEVRSFAEGTLLNKRNNILYNTTRRWKFCDHPSGICWYEVKETADVQFGCGYEIFIQHLDSLVSQYCHLASEPSFVVGDPITVGQTIGFQGSTGWATGKHLHFALLRNGQPIDPAYAFLQTSLSNWEE